MGSATSSRLVVGAAILALVLVGGLAVVVINSSPFSDPLARNLIRPADAPLPQTGTLVVRMGSNENFSSVVSMPLSQPAPVGKWPMAVITVNASVVAAMPQGFKTDAEGVAHVNLLPGFYILEAPYNTLRIAVPVHIFSGNTTTVQLNVTEGAYPLIYSEEEDVAAIPSIFVQVLASGPVADAGSLVTLDETNSAGQFQVFAGVVTDWPPQQGTDWLRLSTASPFDLASADAAVVATWSYSSSVTIAPS